jgi:hypothetical protein
MARLSVLGDLATDSQDGPPEVRVLPFKPEHFAAPKTRVEREEDHGLEVVREATLLEVGVWLITHGIPSLIPFVATIANLFLTAVQGGKEPLAFGGSQIPDLWAGVHEKAGNV